MRNFKLILVVLSMLPVQANALEVPFFPRLTASNLEKQRFVLPRDFAGDRNIVVIAYKRGQQADVDTWMPWLNRIVAARRDVRWYELPTISKTTGTLLGWFIDRGMRRGIADIRQRQRTITLYLDKDRFRETLGLPDSEDMIQILVVTRRGDILGRSSGRFSEAKAAAIETALAPGK